MTHHFADATEIKRLSQRCGPLRGSGHVSSAQCATTLTFLPHPTPTPPYLGRLQFRVISGSAKVTAGVVTAELATHVTGAPPFSLTLRAYSTGVLRMRVLEKNDLPPRWEVRPVGRRGWPQTLCARARPHLIVRPPTPTYLASTVP